MSVEVRIPKEDSPRVVQLALVGAIALGAGVLLAWWASEPERAAHGEVVADASPNEPPLDELPSSDEVVLDSSPLNEHFADEESVLDGAEPAPDVMAQAPPEPEAVSAAELDPAPEERAEPTEPAPSAPSALRVVRGRVAYIRCDGLASCPRDEPLEAAVWSILDRLPECASAPTTPGHADIRLDFRRDAAPEIAWRDTFHSSVVRLDRESVMGCVSEQLAETRQSVGADRLLASFRFELVSR